MFALAGWHLWFHRIASFLTHRHTRRAAAWLVAVATVAHMTYCSWNFWNRDNRLDGNEGHATIDFGSQWVMGRMLYLGEGANLYERDHIRAVLKEAYPRELEGDAKKDKE